MRKVFRISILFVLFALIVSSFIYWQNRERVQNEMYRTYYGQHGVPAENIDIYEQAAARYGIDWKLLASIHRVETIFSNSSAMQSSVGAIGPFQFMPKTWVGWGYEGGTSLGDIEHDGIDVTDPEAIEKYGGLGVDADGDGKADPTSLVDSAHTAAKYLNQHDVRRHQTETRSRQHCLNTIAVNNMFLTCSPNMIVTSNTSRRSMRTTSTSRRRHSHSSFASAHV